MGKISYGLYLWHYPLFRVAEAQAPKVGISVPFAMALAAEAGFRVLRQERRQVDLPIPESLRGQYPETLLRNNEILLLLGKH